MNEKDTADAPVEPVASAHFDPNHEYLKNKVVILNGFSNDEIVAILGAVKALCKPLADGSPGPVKAASTDLVFAKTTERSLRTVLGSLIIDMSGDHEYLRKNPPQIGK